MHNGSGGGDALFLGRDGGFSGRGGAGGLWRARLHELLDLAFALPPQAGPRTPGPLSARSAGMVGRRGGAGGDTRTEVSARSPFRVLSRRGRMGHVPARSGSTG